MIDIIGIKSKDGEIIDDISLGSYLEECLYFIKDSMLMFYYSVVFSRLDDIKTNYRKTLFKDIIDSQNFPVINGFTGEAFERMIISVLNNKKNRFYSYI